MQQPGMGITDDDKRWACASWLLSPLIPLVVFLWKKKRARPYIRYNAVLATMYVVVGYSLSLILVSILVGCLVGVGVFVYQIYLAILAYGGVWITLPVLTLRQKSSSPETEAGSPPFAKKVCDPHKLLLGTVVRLIHYSVRAVSSL